MNKTERDELVQRYSVHCHCGAVNVIQRDYGHLVMHSDYLSTKKQLEEEEVKVDLWYGKVADLEARLANAENNYANEADARKQVEQNYLKLEEDIAELRGASKPVYQMSIGAGELASWVDMTQKGYEKQKQHNICRVLFTHPVQSIGEYQAQGVEIYKAKCLQSIERIKGTVHPDLQELAEEMLLGIMEGCDVVAEEMRSGTLPDKFNKPTDKKD